jgi:Mg-chelatase subunit ChlD
MSKIRRICLFAGPGVGKSTTAARVFYELKIKGYDIELIQEYVKTWAHQGKTPVSYDQNYLFSKQLKSEDEALRKLQLVVTDSPLLLNAAYAHHNEFPGSENLIATAQKFDNEFLPLNLFIDRTVDYVEKGRYQDLAQALQFDEYLLDFLNKRLTHSLQHVTVNNFDQILSLIEENING